MFICKIVSHGIVRLANIATHPVGRSGDGDTLATDAQRPDFGDQDPGEWSTTVAKCCAENDELYILGLRAASFLSPMAKIQTNTHATQPAAVPQISA